MISRYSCILYYIVFHYIIMYPSISKTKHALLVYCKYRYSTHWFYFPINKKICVLEMICIVKTATYIAYADHTSYPYMLSMKSKQYMLWNILKHFRNIRGLLKNYKLLSFTFTEVQGIKCSFIFINKNLIITCTIWHQSLLKILSWSDCFLHSLKFLIV